MKLMIAVVQDKDAGRLIETLMGRGFGVTKLASTGGFLKEGNTTLMVGAEAPRIAEAVDLVKNLCPSRRQVITPLAPVGGPVDSYVPYPVEVQVGGATIFVLDVERFEKV